MPKGKKFYDNPDSEEEVQSFSSMASMLRQYLSAPSPDSTSHGKQNSLGIVVVVWSSWMPNL
jgi:hypothetical protein